jgi:hypothetical protein
MDDMRGQNRAVSSGLDTKAWLLALLLLLNGAAGMWSALRFYTGDVAAFGILEIGGGWKSTVAGVAYTFAALSFFSAGACLLLRRRVARVFFLAGAFTWLAVSFWTLFDFVWATGMSLWTGTVDTGDIVFGLIMPLAMAALALLIVRAVHGYLSDRVSDGTLR